MPVWYDKRPLHGIHITEGTSVLGVEIIKLVKPLVCTVSTLQRRQSVLKSGGSWIWVKTISIFPGKFPKNFDFSGNFTKKFRCFQPNFRKISIFSSNLTKNFYFSRQMSEKFRFFRQFKKKIRISRQK